MTVEEPETRVQRYLYQYIPLSAAMGVQVRTASVGHVKLAAPLRPNVNHTETVFGGSAAALATLSAWTLLHLRLENARLDARLVIQRSRMERIVTYVGQYRLKLVRDGASFKFAERIVILAQDTLRSQGVMSIIV